MTFIPIVFGSIVKRPSTKVPPCAPASTKLVVTHGPLAEDRHLPALLQAVDEQVVRPSAERPLHHSAVAAALFQVRALHGQSLGPPLRVPLRVADQLADALDRSVDERALGARPVRR